MDANPLLAPFLYERIAEHQQRLREYVNAAPTPLDTDPAFGGS